MNSTIRELEPRELQAVIGGALYGVTATAFRLPGRAPADSAVMAAVGGLADPASLRRAS